MTKCHTFDTHDQHVTLILMAVDTDHDKNVTLDTHDPNVARSWHTEPHDQYSSTRL